MTTLHVRDTNGNYIAEFEIEDELDREHIGESLRESDTGAIILTVSYRETDDEEES